MCLPAMGLFVMRHIDLPTIRVINLAFNLPAVGLVNYSPIEILRIGLDFMDLVPLDLTVGLAL